MAATLTLQRAAVRRISDADVLTRAAAGDAVAFSEVYRRFQKRIYGYCLARTLDPNAAADATQEVFLRVLRADVCDVQQATAYLFRIARNVLIDAARKRARTPQEEGLEPDSPAWDRLKAADTADEVMTRAEARDVFLALRTMRPRYRTALVMRDMHGESSADMANALGTTPGAVDTLVSRARDAFGVAYASVRDLPGDCRAATELIYREHGSGISPQESAALATHIGSCERCRAESARANDPRHLPALLPFLLPAKRAAETLLQRATLALGNVPDAAVQQAASVASQPHGWSLAWRLGAGALALAAVAAPVALSPTRHPVAVAEQAAARPSVMQAYQHDTAHAQHLTGGVCTDEFWSEQRAGHVAEAAHDAASETHAPGEHDSGGSGSGSHSTPQDHHSGGTGGGMTSEPSHASEPSGGSHDSTHDSSSASPDSGGSVQESDGEHAGGDSAAPTDGGMASR